MQLDKSWWGFPFKSSQNLILFATPVLKRNDSPSPLLVKAVRGPLSSIPVMNYCLHSRNKTRDRLQTFSDSSVTLRKRIRNDLTPEPTKTSNPASGNSDPTRSSTLATEDGDTDGTSTSTTEKCTRTSGPGFGTILALTGFISALIYSVYRSLDREE